MIRVDNWLPYTSRTTAFVGRDETVDIGQFIANNSTSITLRRNGVDKPAQTVRIERLGVSTGQKLGVALVPTELGANPVLIVGYRGHETVEDTDIKRGDRFWYDAHWYEVINVIMDVSDVLYAVATESLA